MPEKGIRSTYSQCPFRIGTWDSQGELASGTGFLYEVDNGLFLITNWHVVSGKHAFTKGPLSSSHRFPEYITANIATYVDDDMFKFAIRSLRIEIYSDGTPAWFEHPGLGSVCDVVAIPFSRPSACPPFMHNAANKISTTRIPVTPGTSIFVVGFPMAISVGFGLPLWKSGYVASEPYYDIEIEGLNVPAFFLDTQTRSGMSGAPVFASYTGMWDVTDPYAKIDLDDPSFWDRDDVVLNGTANEFVGCYSGRVLGRENEAALGLCWQKDAIDLICTNGVPGKHPHIT